MSDAPSSPEDAPKIIVDSDWKAQAQAEKERLAASESKPAASGGGEDAGPGADGAPPTPFMALVGTVAVQGLMFLGAFPDPQTQQVMVAPARAKEVIDMLAALEEKTRGNLSKEEEDELKGIVHELRMRFVQIAGRLEELAAQEQAGGEAGQDAANT